MILRMKELSDIIRERRAKRGSIDFDFPETKIILDEKGRPVEIKPYDRNDATKIIEDFMLLANETLQRNISGERFLSLQNQHDVPDEEKIRKLGTFINNFGYNLHVRNEVRPKEIQKLLCKVEGTPEEPLISRACPAVNEAGKIYNRKYRAFWTGSEILYAFHFSDPPYPDLQIHRHQGKSAGKADRGTDGALQKDSDRSCISVQSAGADSGRVRA